LDFPSSQPPKEEDKARWRDATGGGAIISDEGVRGSRRDLRRPERGGFSPSPPSSRTTGVTQERRPCRPDSTGVGWLAWLIIALAAAEASILSWRIAAFYISDMHAKNTYGRKIKMVYVVYVLLDGIATAIGEVGISGYIAYIHKHRRDL
jgi:hypothetical protein